MDAITWRVAWTPSVIDTQQKPSKTDPSNFFLIVQMIMPILLKVRSMIQVNARKHDINVQYLYDIPV